MSSSPQAAVQCMSNSGSEMLRRTREAHVHSGPRWREKRMGLCAGCKEASWKCRCTGTLFDSSLSKSVATERSLSGAKKRK